MVCKHAPSCENILTHHVLQVVLRLCGSRIDELLDGLGIRLRIRRTGISPLPLTTASHPKLGGSQVLQNASTHVSH